MTPRAVDVGAELYLGIFFRTLRDGPRVIVANVVRCTAVDGTFHLGLQFVSENAAQREAFKTCSNACATGTGSEVAGSPVYGRA